MRAELDSSDSIDLLCAFVMWHGQWLIEKPLETAREAGIPIRVVTTTYIGARPIAITWRLETPMPTDFFNRASVAAG